MKTPKVKVYSDGDVYYSGIRINNKWYLSFWVKAGRLGIISRNNETGNNYTAIPFNDPIYSLAKEFIEKKQNEN